MSLQSRVIAFLGQAVPDDVDYVADSMAERILSAYAKGGRIDSDPDQLELLELCLLESRAAAEEGGPGRRAWFNESADLLEAIQAECS